MSFERLSPEFRDSLRNLGDTLVAKRQANKGTDAGTSPRHPEDAAREQWVEQLVEQGVGQAMSSIVKTLPGVDSTTMSGIENMFRSVYLNIYDDLLKKKKPGITASCKPSKSAFLAYVAASYDELYESRNEPDKEMMRKASSSNPGVVIVALAMKAMKGEGAKTP